MIGYKRIQLIIERALKLSANTGAKIMNYGSDNLYPQNIANLIYASKSATAAVEKATENIMCEGFANPEFAARTNANGQNMDDILEATANDVARFKGWAWIIQYGFTPSGFAPVNIYPVPFEFVRAELSDNYMKNPKVYKWKVFNNWDRTNVKASNPSENSTTYPTYDPANFMNEVNEDYGGDFTSHPGQLLYVNLGTTKPYPLSTFHAVQNEMGAEEKNGKYVNRTLGRGFHMLSIVTHGRFEEDAEQDDFRSALEDLMGSDNAGAVLTVRDDNMMDSDRPFIKVDQVGSAIDKDLYKAYVDPIRKDIAIAAWNLPMPLMDSSAVSYTNASGEVIKELQRVYRRSLLKVRNRISRELFQLFNVDSEYTKIKNDLEDVKPI